MILFVSLHIQRRRDEGRKIYVNKIDCLTDVVVGTYGIFNLY